VSLLKRALLLPGRCGVGEGEVRHKEERRGGQEKGFLAALISLAPWRVRPCASDSFLSIIGFWDALRVNEWGGMTRKTNPAFRLESGLFSMAS
jgi:hypothetical protein